ncbi:Uncharacterised protein [Candidatus Gugararchaeum adminiculabundum]|nr:Uncharacterised protein [Candidatus Gugararchaeum adminiculabundum]
MAPDKMFKPADAMAKWRKEIEKGKEPEPQPETWRDYVRRTLREMEALKRMQEGKAPAEVVRIDESPDEKLKRIRGGAKWVEKTEPAVLINREKLDRVRKMLLDSGKMKEKLHIPRRPKGMEETFEEKNRAKVKEMQPGEWFFGGIGFSLMCFGYKGNAKAPEYEKPLPSKKSPETPEKKDWLETALKLVVTAGAIAALLLFFNKGKELIIRGAWKDVTSRPVAHETFEKGFARICAEKNGAWIFANEFFSRDILNISTYLKYMEIKSAKIVYRTGTGKESETEPTGTNYTIWFKAVMKDGSRISKQITGEIRNGLNGPDRRAIETLLKFINTGIGGQRSKQKKEPEKNDQKGGRPPPWRNYYNYSGTEQARIPDGLQNWRTVMKKAEVPGKGIPPGTGNRTRTRGTC